MKHLYTTTRFDPQTNPSRKKKQEIESGQYDLPSCQALPKIKMTFNTNSIIQETYKTNFSNTDIKIM